MKITHNLLLLFMHRLTTPLWAFLEHRAQRRTFLRLSVTFSYQQLGRSRSLLRLPAISRPRCVLIGGSLTPSSLLLCTQIIAEGANGPTTIAAEKVLHAKNVLVIPVRKTAVSLFFLHHSLPLLLLLLLLSGYVLQRWWSDCVIL